MKKIIPIILIIIITISAIAIFSIPSIRYNLFGVELKYKFFQGEKINYKTKVDMSIDFNKGPKAIVGKDISAKFERDSIWRISKVVGDTITIINSGKIKKGDISLGGKTISLNDDNNKESRIVIEQDMQGKVINVETGGRQKDDRENIQSQMTFLWCNVLLPKGKVMIGRTWEENIDAYMTQQIIKTRIKGTIHYKFEKIEKYNKKLCALITYDDSFDTTSKIGGSNKIGFDTTVKMKGKAYLDIDSGKMIFSEREINLEMSKTIPLLNIPLSANAKFRVVYEKKTGNGK
ncbi:MAG: hypothetical protein K8T10_17105 [Candidatus Eremiobacteraeota bacterium]|nr:hypothetical protein [Candidatus Eremiobacteraeota bacterium]